MLAEAERGPGCKWASENFAAAATRIQCHWNLEQEGPPDTHVPGEDETWDGAGEFGELLEAETTCMLALMEE